MNRKRLIAGMMAGIVVCGMMPGSAYAVGENEEDVITVHVSAEGDDAANGSEKHPFQTIQRAQQEVRKLNDDMEKDIEVIIHEGTYYMDKTLEFTSEDSATNGYRISYEAAPNEKVLISGGVDIESEWEDTGDGIYKTNVGEKRFRQLYVNGEKAYRSTTRKIKEDGKYDVNYFRAILDKERSKLTVSKNDFDLSLLSPKQLEQVNMVLLQYWSESTVRLDKLLEDRDDQCDVSLGDEEHEILKIRQYAQLYDTGNPYYLENARAFIDQGGEWFLDDETGDLYYKVRQGENIQDLTMTVPMTETLWRLKGTYDKPIENMEIHGLEFAYSTWMYPSEHGCIGAQAGLYNTRVEENNQQWVARPSAGIEVSATRNFVFERNTIRNMGATGLDLHLGTQNSEIIGNVIRDISGVGIMLAEFSPGEFHIPYQPEDIREICKDDKIQNNYITKIGTDYPGAAAIAAGYPQGAVIEHNEIHDTPYTGITVGWGWHHNQKTPMEYNMIRYNELYDVVNGLSDGGGIYTLSNQPNSQIVKNYIHDISRNFAATPTGQANFPLAAIYLDEGTQGIRVQDNVIANMGDTTKRIHHNANENGSTTTDNTKMLTDVVQNAGLEDDYKDIKTGIKSEKPVIKTVTSPVQERAEVTVTGQHFGNEKGKVSIDFKKQNYDIAGEKITSWVDDKITFILPPEVREGDAAIYVKTKEGYKDSAEIEVWSKGLLKVDENFDKYENGELPANEIWKSCSNAAVVEQSGTKVLQLSSMSENAKAWMASMAENYTLSFDMMLKTEPQTRGDGLYLTLKSGMSLEWIHNNNGEKFNFSKNGVRVSSVDYPPEINKWKVVKLEMQGGSLKAKIWDKGSEEPQEWMIETNDTDTTVPLQFEYYHSSGGQILFDNIYLEETEKGNDNGTEVNLDFETYEEGTLQPSDILETVDGATVEKSSDSTVVKLAGKGSNSGFKLKGDYVNYDLQMDFCFDSELPSGYGAGMYIHLRDSGAEYIRTKYLPAGNPVFSLEKNGTDVLDGISDLNTKNDIWYTLKVFVKGNSFYAKTWEREQAEPEEWVLLAENEDPQKGRISIEYYADSSDVLIDNVSISNVDFNIIDNTKSISAVEKVEDKTVWAGTSAYNLGLPEYLKLELNGKPSDRQARIEWQYQTYKPKDTREQLIEGDLKTDYDVENPDNIKAQVKVTAIDSAELQSAVKEAQSKAEHAYTPESYETLKAALKEATDLLAGEPGSAENVTEKTQKLRNAIDSLALDTDMEALKGLLEEGQSLLETAKDTLYEKEEEKYDGYYAKEKYDELSRIRESADAAYEELLSNAGMDEEEFDVKLRETITGLTGAIENFNASKIKVDRTALEELITAAKELNASDYTEESYAALQEAVAEAEKVLAGKVTQKIADAQLQVLEKAFGSLELKIDKTVLEGVIKDAAAVDLKKYEDGKEKDRFVKALENAQQLLKDEDVTQKEINAAVRELKEAQKNLKLKEETEPSKPEEPDKGENAGVGKEDNGTNGTGSLGNGQNKAPKTGDDSFPLGYVVLLMLSGAAVVLKKRKTI